MDSDFPCLEIISFIFIFVLCAICFGVVVESRTAKCSLMVLTRNAMANEALSNTVVSFGVLSFHRMANANTFQAPINVDFCSCFF